MKGTVARVITLLMTVGLPNRPLMRGQRRLGAHLAAPALQAFQQRGLLAADVGAGADALLDVERRVQQVRQASRAIAMRASNGGDGVGIFRADVDVALGRADRETGDGHALDQANGSPSISMRSAIGAGIALIGVADDVFRRRAAASATVFHLMPVGKPAPPRPRRPDAVTASTMAGRAERPGAAPGRPCRHGHDSRPATADRRSPQRAKVSRV